MQPVLNKALPFRTINDIAIHFQDNKTCLEYLTQLRWGGKPKCVFCGHDHCYELKGANKRYKCAKCRKQFSAIKGSIFENSTVPLCKWFMAIFILSTHRKGISSVQVSRDIGVTQKTAWFMMQRVRNAFKQHSFETQSKIGGSKIVEADELYINPVPSNMHTKRRIKYEEDGKPNRIVIAGAIERKGEVRVTKVQKASVNELVPFLIKNVVPGSNLMTDEHMSYEKLHRIFDHNTVKHALKEYVRIEESGRRVSTNAIENFWSVLIRALAGTYHQISGKHCQNYLEEFAFRFNSRDYTEAQRFDKLISLSNYRIDYATLTETKKVRKAKKD